MKTQKSRVLGTDGPCDNYYSGKGGTTMMLDSALIAAAAVAFGSLVGAAATVATTWMTQRNQVIRGHVEWNLRERDALYGEFIKEASHLAVDALHHSLDD